MKILFLDFSTRLDTINDLKSRARGGMVTSLFKVSDVLSQLGHEVFVVSDISKDGKTDSGTIWCAETGACFLKGYDWDFLICNRSTGEGYTGIKAKHRILWTHDLPHNGFIPDPRVMTAFSATVFMSNYAERIWRAFYKTIHKSFLIPNGVDKDLFYPREKDLDYLIYCSAPNRGLKRLPLIYDAVKSRTRDSVYMNAYSNLEKMHPNEALTSPDHAADYEKVSGSEVTLLDPIPQKEFAEQIGKAGLAIMPSNYPEICSNNVLQSLASGTPVITTGNLGSACEWVKHKKNGMLTKFQVNDYMIYSLEFVRNCVDVLNTPDFHCKLIHNASKTKVYSWEQIGDKWEKMLKKLL